ncbi:MAG: ImmA/IrrE family metallo-endopeptidase [Anaerolineae bacterium]|nr:ImmA/IrrE family metallo-endopeptidase [Anaerolineae bacterium]
MKGRQFGRIKSDKELEALIRNKVIAERRKLKEKDLVTKSSIVEHYGLELDFCPLGVRDGMLVDNKKIVLNSLLRQEERLNFTFYHELTHYFINSDDELLSNIHECSGNIDETIEKLCNCGAAELLLPNEEILNAITEHGFTVTLLPSFCGEYSVSSIAAGIQMVRCALHNCYLVIANLVSIESDSIQMSFERQENVPQFQLSVTYSASSSNAKYRITRTTPIPQTHAIWKAYAEQTHVIEEKSYVPFRSGKKLPAKCDALYFRGQVIAILNVDNIIVLNPNQLRLL